MEEPNRDQDQDEQRNRRQIRRQIRNQNRNRNRRPPDPESKELITSPNLASMETFISNLHNDDQRSDRIISFCTGNYPNTFSLKLSHLSLSSPHLRADSFDVFLRVLYSPELKFNLSPMILAEIKPTIFECLRQESTTNPPSKALSKTISGIASLVYSDSDIAEKWPEVLDYVASSVSASDDNNNKNLQEWGLFILRYLTERTLEQLDSRFGVIFTSVLRHLTSSDLDTRAAAFRASVNLVRSCTHYSNLYELLPRMMSSVENLISGGHHVLAAKALRTLVQMAMDEPGYLVEQLQEVFESVVRIAERDNIDEETRAEAVQIIRELEDGAGPDMQKLMEDLSGESIERFVRLMANFLEYVEDDPYWYRIDHVVTQNNTNMEEKRTILLGTYFLDRLSFIHKRKVVTIVVILARERFKAQEWRKRHAGITAIAVISEGCSEEIIDYLDQVMALALDLFRDFHPRVRAAAINVIRTLGLDLGGSTIQEKYHDKILPALGSLVGDSLSPTLQVQAAMAFVSFCKGCEPDHLEPFLEGLVKRLLIVCQSQHQVVQEWGFAALASVANSSQSKFSRLYDPTMACLKDILLKNTENSTKLICAKCLECISRVAVAVGKEKFSSDSIQALANLFDCLREDLSSYVPDLMPSLLQSSQLFNPDVAEASSDPSNKFDALKEEALACRVLFCIAKKLRRTIFPWIIQVAKALIPLLQVSQHPETQKIAISALPELLLSAISYRQSGNSKINITSFTQKLALLIVPALSEALQMEPEGTMQTKFLSAIYKCIQVSGSVFTRAQALSIVNGIKKVLADISGRDEHPVNAEGAEDSEMDSEDVKEQEEEIFRQVTNCLCGLIKRFRRVFMPYFDEIVIYIPMMWDDRRNAEEKAMGLSIFRNIVHQCGVNAEKYHDMYLPCLLIACKEDDPLVRQEAALGIGACAESGEAFFRTRVEAALESLDSLIKQPEALSPENRKTFDAAVSALGKICRFHRNFINARELVPTWLSYLPLVRDLDEAKKAHDLLCLMVEK
ncbi:importin-5 [Morus notabilis]|uniref:importin-5 n=1 Tax=Morus notabilis TaxID=981085 RepID=UPI000CED6FC5|nr:importin-5 [Morus notabilis]